VSDNERLYAHFFKFGTGAENTFDFRAVVNWEDVEAIVAAFSKVGHPAAIQFERAKKLAAALDEFVVAAGC
jgi:hypothetical protein